MWNYQMSGRAKWGVGEAPKNFKGTLQEQCGNRLLWNEGGKAERFFTKLLK